MKTLPAAFPGRWRITWMQEWAQRMVDLEGSGFLRLDRDGSGEMQFIAVRAWLDCEPGERDGKPAVEFSWEGSDDRDSRCGRGWLSLIGPDELEGYFSFHMGDASMFRAKREQAVEVARPARVRRLAPRRRRTSA
jgi:hypothetical protein